MNYSFGSAAYMVYSWLNRQVTKSHIPIDDDYLMNSNYADDDDGIV